MVRPAPLLGGPQENERDVSDVPLTSKFSTGYATVDVTTLKHSLRFTTYMNKMCHYSTRCTSVQNGMHNLCILLLQIMCKLMSSQEEN